MPFISRPRRFVLGTGVEIVMGALSLKPSVFAIRKSVGYGYLFDYSQKITPGKML
jgi:hypothetical protein